MRNAPQPPPAVNSGSARPVRRERPGAHVDVTIDQAVTIDQVATIDPHASPAKVIAMRAAREQARQWSGRGALPAMVMVLLVGCSSTVTPDSPSSTTDSSPTTLAGESTIATTIPFNVARNARQEVTTRSCREVGGVWVLSGTVNNSAKTARSYQIVVDFVNQNGNTVEDTKILNTASVRPGATVAWSAKSVAGLTDVACVIRYVQSPP